MLSAHPTSFESLSEAQKGRKSPSATDVTQGRSPGCQSSYSLPLSLLFHLRKIICRSHSLQDWSPTRSLRQKDSALHISRVGGDLRCQAVRAVPIREDLLVGFLSCSTLLELHFRQHRCCRDGAGEAGKRECVPLAASRITPGR